MRRPLTWLALLAATASVRRQHFLRWLATGMTSAIACLRCASCWELADRPLRLRVEPFSARSRRSARSAVRPGRAGVARPHWRQPILCNRVARGRRRLATARDRARRGAGAGRAPFKAPGDGPLEAIAVVPGQAEIWLLEAMAGELDWIDSRSAWPPGCWPPGHTHRRVSPRPGAGGGRTGDRAHTDGLALHRGAPWQPVDGGRLTTRISRGSRTTPRPPPTPKAVLRSGPRERPCEPPPPALTARRRRSTPGRCDVRRCSSRSRSAPSLLERRADGVLPDRSQIDDGDRRSAAGARLPSSTGRSASAKETLCGRSRGCCSSRDERQRAEPARARCDRVARTTAARVASSRWPTPTSPSAGWSSMTPKRRRHGANARSSCRSCSATPRRRSTHSATWLPPSSALIQTRAVSGWIGRWSWPSATATKNSAGLTFNRLVMFPVRYRQFDIAQTHLADGLEYCAERGLDTFRLYLLGSRARLQLELGHWTEAGDSAALVLRDPRSPQLARTWAMTTLGLLRTRRGDAEASTPLEEAHAMAHPTFELARIAQIDAARAEAAWLAGNPDAVAEITDAALALAVDRRDSWAAGELTYWRHRAGIQDELPAGLVAEPYRLSISGDWARAAERWRQIGCPYETALALADADDESALQQAFEGLQALGARPAVAIVARRLRERGVRRVPRGPRPQTRENPAGLTTRETQVLGLVAEGLRNAQIAERLVVSEKTVDHHVSAILRKLNVRTRGEASAKAARLGISVDIEPSSVSDSTARRTAQRPYP